MNKCIRKHLVLLFSHQPLASYYIPSWLPAVLMSPDYWMNPAMCKMSCFNNNFQIYPLSVDMEAEIPQSSA